MIQTAGFNHKNAVLQIIYYKNHQKFFAHLKIVFHAPPKMIAGNTAELK